MVWSQYNVCNYQGRKDLFVKLKKSFIGLLFLVYVSMLIATLPVRVVTWFVPSSSQFALAEPQGTLWQGSIGTVKISSWLLENISWKLNGAALLWLNLKADVAFGFTKSLASGAASIQITPANVSLNQLRLSASLAALSAQMQLPFNAKLDGQLALNIKSFKVSQQLLCDDLQGQIQVPSLGLSNDFGQYALGKMQISLDCDNQSIRLSTLESSNDLGLNATILIDAQQNVNVKGRVHAVQTMPEEIQNFLPMLGARDIEGYYNIDFQGTLP
jgi:general secretion pathway protein N